MPNTTYFESMIRRDREIEGSKKLDRGKGGKNTQNTLSKKINTEKQQIGIAVNARAKG
ncbi:hypothetical protein [Sphingobacterium haloxyli]|uniref:hypothetical protein n=1 Tax=Sphingobacterium haloxyli TaxID=2100533 RepID=UPI0013FD282B|nr:hypothetical protein [Sphingobacterium haloxyli]